MSGPAILLGVKAVIHLGDEGSRMSGDGIGVDLCHGRVIVVVIQPLFHCVVCGLPLVPGAASGQSQGGNGDIGQHKQGQYPSEDLTDSDGDTFDLPGDQGIEFFQPDHGGG